MAFLGKVGGPCLSEIIDRLGPEYFGISATALEEDFCNELLSEAVNRESVKPVYKDKEGQLCYIFTAPGNKKQLYHLTPEEIKKLGDDYKFEKLVDFKGV